MSILTSGYMDDEGFFGPGVRHLVQQADEDDAASSVSSTVPIRPEKSAHSHSHPWKSSRHDVISKTSTKLNMAKKQEPQSLFSAADYAAIAKIIFNAPPETPDQPQKPAPTISKKKYPGRLEPVRKDGPWNFPERPLSDVTAKPVMAKQSKKEKKAKKIVLPKPESAIDPCFKVKVEEPPAHKQAPKRKQPTTKNPAKKIKQPSELANAEPANAEPANAEPANAEPANAEPANAEPANAEPANAEPANAEPANAEPQAMLGTASDSWGARADNEPYELEPSQGSQSIPTEKKHSNKTPSRVLQSARAEKAKSKRLPSRGSLGKGLGFDEPAPSSHKPRSQHSVAPEPELSLPLPRPKQDGGTKNKKKARKEAKTKKAAEVLGTRAAITTEKPKSYKRSSRLWLQSPTPSAKFDSWEMDPHSKPDSATSSGSSVTATASFSGRSNRNTSKKSSGSRHPGSGQKQQGKDIQGDELCGDASGSDAFGGANAGFANGAPDGKHSSYRLSESSISHHSKRTVFCPTGSNSFEDSGPAAKAGSVGLRHCEQASRKTESRHSHSAGSRRVESKSDGRHLVSIPEDAPFRSNEESALPAAWEEEPKPPSRRRSTHISIRSRRSAAPPLGPPAKPPVSYRAPTVQEVPEEWTPERAADYQGSRRSHPRSHRSHPSTRRSYSSTRRSHPSIRRSHPSSHRSHPSSHRSRSTESWEQTQVGAERPASYRRPKRHRHSEHSSISWKSLLDVKVNDWFENVPQPNVKALSRALSKPSLHPQRNHSNHEISNERQELTRDNGKVPSDTSITTGYTKKHHSHNSPPLPQDRNLKRSTSSRSDSKSSSIKVNLWVKKPSVRSSKLNKKS